MKSPVINQPSNQLTLSFEPGLCERHLSLPELSKLGLAKVVKLDDGADMVRGGFRVWAAV